MNHDMLDAPAGQQQQVGRITDAAFLHVTHAPTGYHRFVTNGGWADSHHPCIPFYHRFNQFSHSLRCFQLLSPSGQRKLMKEVRPLLLSFSGFLSGLYNPFLMLADKRIHLSLRYANRSRHMYIAILHNAHRQSARPFVCQLNLHLSVFRFPTRTAFSRLIGRSPIVVEINRVQRYEKDS